MKIRLSLVLKSAGIGNTVEPRNALAGGGRKGPDLEVYGFPTDDRTTWIDVAVVNPMSGHYVDAAARIPLHAASVREHCRNRTSTPR